MRICFDCWNIVGCHMGAVFMKIIRSDRRRVFGISCEIMMRPQPPRQPSSCQWVATYDLVHGDTWPRELRHPGTLEIDDSSRFSLLPLPVEILKGVPDEEGADFLCDKELELAKDGIHLQIVAPNTCVLLCDFHLSMNLECRINDHGETKCFDEGEETRMNEHEA